MGEYKLRISHSFVCSSEENWDDIMEANSHPIAFVQRHEFPGQYPHIRVVEGGDTAFSAEIIKKENLRGYIAIRSKAAAERYGVRVLQEGIKTNKCNFTCFLVATDPWQVNELNRHRSKEVNKTSMVLTLPRAEGSLSQVLPILSSYRINLTEVQSLPIIGREWECQSYVDAASDNVLKYKQSIMAITPLTKEFEMLGEYEDGESNI